MADKKPKSLEEIENELQDEKEEQPLGMIVFSRPARRAASGLFLCLLDNLC